MIISYNDWENYIQKLSQLSTIAAEKMQKYIDLYGVENRNRLITYAHELIKKYGGGSAELACQMYDAIADIEKADVPMAEVVYIDDISATGKQVNGSLKRSPAGNLLPGLISKQVKQAGADTTLKNAIRDGAQIAWIPHGDTCPFCLTLASNGWRYASKKALRNGHADHIHSYCDCQYAIRFTSDTNYAGYNPDEYLEMYENAEGRTTQEKVNYLRRIQYASNKDMINAQHREAYQKRKENE